MIGFQRLQRVSPGVAVTLMAALLMAGVGTGFALEQMREPQWQASTDVLVRTWSIDSLLLTGQSNPVSTEDQADAAVVAVSQQVLERAATDLGDGRSWSDLAETVTAVPVPTSHFVSITASGIDSDTAQRTSQGVADAFAVTMQEDLSTAAAGLTSTAVGAQDPDIQLRAQLLGSALQPIEVFRTTQPEQLVPTSQTPIAFGVVGLAVGALTVLALALTGPTVRTARDAQRLLGLPAAGFHRPEGGPDAALLITRLLEGSPNRMLMICPVNAGAEKSGLELVEWIQDRGQRDLDPGRVQLVPEPTGAVLGTRPRRVAVAALVLIVPEGTPRQEVADAVALLGSWRGTDAVIVAT